MALLRTPDDRFVDLPGFPYAVRSVDDLPGCEGIRVAMVDEGGQGRAGVALCLHGNPTWGYLYRSMIPGFVAAGLRVVVPDLIGFGRSDKPEDPAFHTFECHRRMLLALIERLDLRDVMLVCQDWGGLLGLTLPVEMPERFSRLLVMNTFLATGEPPSPGFFDWRAYCNRTPDMAVGRMIARGRPDLPAAEAAAYDAPFPDARHKIAIARFANMVPDHPLADGAAISRAAGQFLRDQWRGDSFMAIGMADPVITPDRMAALQQSIRGCPPAMQVPAAGHFVPEWGGPIAAAALAHFGFTAPTARS